jgi:hypothetical protein
VPNVPDAHGDFMTPDEVRKMAHNFMRSGNTHVIDVNHDNNLTRAYVVESFIAREGDPVFAPESWVVGVHIPDPELWEAVKSGELNGFSFEGLVHYDEVEVEIELPDTITLPTINDSTGHTHTVTVHFNESGDFIGGLTDVVDGHYHTILSHTVTEVSEGHTHKFDIVEALKNATYKS